MLTLGVIHWPNPRVTRTQIKVLQWFLFLSVSRCHGSQPGPGLQKEVVDGHHSHHRKPALLCRSVGLELTAHHAKERRLLLPRLHWWGHILTTGSPVLGSVHAPHSCLWLSRQWHHSGQCHIAGGSWVAELRGAGGDPKPGLHHRLLPPECSHFAPGPPDGPIRATAAEARRQVEPTAPEDMAQPRNVSRDILYLLTFQFVFCCFLCDDSSCCLQPWRWDA